MHILKDQRARIDAIDDKIVDLLAERESIIREVAGIKAENGIPAVLPDRVAQVRERAVARAAEYGMDAALIRNLYQQLIDYSCNLEETLIVGHNVDNHSGTG
jgi:chorismate mutase-like protein